ncbi:hypothetical protein NFI96_003856 [Prochilodus magdalenae]|nr:hypothetical protein NFI96_003856 [Prochilodus magdalenae]
MWTIAVNNPCWVSQQPPSAKMNWASVVFYKARLLRRAGQYTGEFQGNLTSFFEVCAWLNGEDAKTSILRSMLGNRPKMAKPLLSPLNEEESVAPLAREVYQKATVSKEVLKILREKSQLKQAPQKTLQGPSRLKTPVDEMECPKLLEMRRKPRWQRTHTRVVLMYKASEANTDHTAMLMANNPIQNPTEMDGDDSPTKYLPHDLITKRTPIFSHQHSLPSPTHPPRAGSLKETCGSGSRFPHICPSGQSPKQFKLGAPPPLFSTKGLTSGHCTRPGAVPLWTACLLESPQ